MKSIRDFTIADITDFESILGCHKIEVPLDYKIEGIRFSHSTIVVEISGTDELEKQELHLHFMRNHAAYPPVFKIVARVSIPDRLKFLLPIEQIDSNLEVLYLAEVQDEEDLNLPGLDDIKW